MFGGLFDSSEGVEWSTSFKLPKEELHTDDIAVVSYGDKKLAVGSGALLTLLKGCNEGRYEAEADLEFDGAIECICPDPSGSCIIVGTAGGYLHFVTLSGTLIFSHRVLSKTEENIRFLSITFVNSAGDSDDADATLLAAFDNGRVFGIRNLPTSTICQIASTEPKKLGPLVQKLKFLKCQLPVNPDAAAFRIEIIAVPSDSDQAEDHSSVGIDLDALVLCSDGIVRIAGIGSIDETVNPNTLEEFDGFEKIRCMDVVCIDIGGRNQPSGATTSTAATFTAAATAAVIVAFYSDNSMVVFDSATRDIIARFQLSTCVLRVAQSTPAVISSPTNSTASCWMATIGVLTSLSAHDSKPQLLTIVGDCSKAGKTNCKLISYNLQAASSSPSSSSSSSAGLTLPTAAAAAVAVHDHDDVYRPISTSSTFATFSDSGKQQHMQGYTYSEVVAEALEAISRGLGLGDRFDDPTADDKEEAIAALLIGRMLLLSASNFVIVPELDSSLGLSLADSVLAVLPTLRSCGEVAAVLNASIHCLKNPRRGFLQELVAAAEGAIDTIGSSYADASKDGYLQSLQELLLCLETCTGIASRASKGSLCQQGEGEVTSSCAFTPSAAAGDDTLHEGGELESFSSSSASSPASSIQDPITDHVEERTRLGLLALIGGAACFNALSSDSNQADSKIDSVKAFWTTLVATGRLLDASSVMAVHLAPLLGDNTTTASAIDYVAAVKSVPKSVSVPDLVAWIRTDVLTRADLVAQYSCSTKPDKTKKTTVAVHLVEELCLRARTKEADQKHPFDAVIAAELAHTISMSISTPGGLDNHDINTDNKAADKDKVLVVDASAAIVTACRTLLKNLKIQTAVWTFWGDKVSLDDVIQIGLQGLVFEKLWSLPEASLKEHIESRVRPLVNRFGGEVDQVLFAWLEETVTTLVIVDGSSAYPRKRGSHDDDDDDLEDEHQNSDRDHESDSFVISGNEDADASADASTCTLSRLVRAASLIGDKQIRARALLLLFAVPAVDKAPLHRHSTMTRNPITDIDSKEHMTTALSSVEELCLLARSAAPFVNASTAEALTEAMRLQRMKALAASYGVASFDPRDKQQIRAVATIISLQSSRSCALKDALEFASSWSGDTVDLTGLFARAIVHRATVTNTAASATSERDRVSSNGDDDSFSTGAARRELLIRNAMAEVPPSRAIAIVEDSCNCLLSTLSDLIADAAAVESSSSSSGKLGELPVHSQAEAETLVHSLITISSVYLDSVRDEEVRLAGSIPTIAFSTYDSSSSGSTSSSSSLDSAGGMKSSNETALAPRWSLQSSWVNNDFLSCIKRLRALQADKHIYLTLRDLRNADTCKLVALQLAEEHAEKMVALLGDESSSPVVSLASSPIGVSSHSCNGNGLLASDTRRMCALLGVSPIMIAHSVVKKLIAKGATDLALAVARSLVSVGSSSSKQSSACTAGVTLSADDSALLQDAAVTLGALSARQAQQGALGKTKAPQRGAIVPGAGTSSGTGTAAIAEPFAISCDILKTVSTSCVAEHLPRTLDILNVSELFLDVYQRVEGAQPLRGIFRGENNHSTKTKKKIVDDQSDQNNNNDNGNDHAFKVSEASFSRDGILMMPNVVLGPLLKYAVAEVRRRSAYIVSKGLTTEAALATDVNDLVGVLQRSENNLLAVRVLFGSWHNSAGKTDLLRTSLLSLSRKVLSYREIDTNLVVACMVTLPYDTMVRELKAAVPSVQSDFSRLRTVAAVGEELSRIWDQESLLIVFQGLQANAKWWHILASHGVKIDPRTFQSSDARQRDICIRAIVPELLDRNNMNLEQVVEYCSQFDIEPEFAALCYIEKLLLQVPNCATLGGNDASWAREVRRAASNVEEKAVLTRMRGILNRIHPLDYERIRFVCGWILDALAEDEDVPGSGTGGDENCDANAAEYSYGDDDDDDFGGKNDAALRKLRQSSKSKPKKAAASVDDTTRSIGRIAAEVDMCRRYSDIATFLSSLVFPVHATQSLTTAANTTTGSSSAAATRGEGDYDLNNNIDIGRSILEATQIAVGLASSTVDLYANVSAPYRTRIPFWQLLSDPWSVIDPLLTSAPDVTAKLVPLCRALEVEKDEFTARRTMATYARLCPLTTTGTTGTAEGPSAGSVGDRTAPFDAVVEGVSLIASPVRRVQVWQWILQRERSSGNIDAAVRAITAALKEIDNYAALSGSRQVGDVDSVFEDLMNFRGDLSSDLVCLQCECRIRRCDSTLGCIFRSSSPSQYADSIESSITSSSEQSYGTSARRSDGGFEPPAYYAQLQPLIDDPVALLKRCIVMTVESAWDAQLWSLRSIGAEVLCPLDITERPLVPAVARYLQEVGLMIFDLSGFCKVSAVDVLSHQASASGANAPPQPQQQAGTPPLSGLETLRHLFIRKLLSDCEPGGNSRGAFDSSSSAAAASGASSSFGAGLWSQAKGSALRMSQAEKRRREDVYLGFCIAALVACCAVEVSSRTATAATAATVSKTIPTNGATYISQLDALAQGKGVRNQRRLSTRSRLRAAYALQLISLSVKSGSASLSLPADIAVTSGELSKTVSFLYCLSELLEMRLSCSEETLEAALTLAAAAKSRSPSSSSSTAGAAAAAAVADAQQLVRTWLHDEGSLSEVVELGRDLLLTAGVTDTSAWESILRHMDQRSMTRPLVQTLLLLMRRCPQPLVRLLSGPLRVSIAKALDEWVSEITERSEQVITIIDSRGDESSSASTTASTVVPSKELNTGNAAKLNASVLDATTAAAAVAATSASSSVDAGSIQSARVLLVERSRVSTNSWEDAPEDLVLSLKQASYLLGAILPLIPYKSSSHSSSGGGSAIGGKQGNGGKASVTGDDLQGIMASIRDCHLRLLRLAAQYGSTSSEEGLRGTVLAAVEGCSLQLMVSCCPAAANTNTITTTTTAQSPENAHVLSAISSLEAVVAAAAGRGGSVDKNINLQLIWHVLKVATRTSPTALLQQGLLRLVLQLQLQGQSQVNTSTASSKSRAGTTSTRSGPSAVSSEKTIAAGACVSSAGVGVGATLLANLLKTAADDWGRGDDGREATRLILSLCLSIAAGTGGDNVSETGNIHASDAHAALSSVKKDLSSSLTTLSDSHRKSLVIVSQVLSDDFTDSQLAIMRSLFNSR